MAEIDLNQEFSNEFDIFYNSIASNQAPGLDEYEKSVFLTKAQEEIVEGLYTGKILGDSFEDTEQLRRYLSDLVKAETLNCYSLYNGISKNSVFATLPDDLWFITYESAELIGEEACIDGKEVLVIPITQDEYHRIKGNPFRRQNSRRVLKLDAGPSTVELISDNYIKSYSVRYMSRPEPIVLEDLADGLSINGVNTKTECKLNPGIHRMIIEVAVNMAIRTMIQGSGK